MPIRAMDVYVRELRLQQETRIGLLSETRLGIEGHNWLRQLMTSTRDGESVAMDGPPQALEAAITADVQYFRRSGITPVIVFNGLPVARKDQRAFAKEDYRLGFRNAAWEAYGQRHEEQALRGWSTASPHAQADMLPFVMRVLQGLGVEYMRAPYSSWAQLAYMSRHEQQPIHAVYASLDVLMFDVDRVITSVNQQKGTFTWVQRDNLASKCGVAPEQLLDMCILAGFDWCPTFPPLVTDIGFSFKSAADATRMYRSGFNAIQMISDPSGAGARSAAGYMDSFLRAYCMVRYHIVMHADGSVGPLNPEYAPNDIHDLIGYRLPPVAYQLLAQCVVQPSVLTMLVSGSWIEFPPADNGESTEYRGLITGWERGIYRNQCAALCDAMGSFYKQRKIVMHTWFDPQSELALHEAKPPKLTAQQQQQQQQQAVPVQLLAQSGGASEGKAGVGIESVLGRSQALMSQPASAGDVEAVLLAGLGSLGFVATGSGQHTQLGRALAAGLRALAANGGAGGDGQQMQWAVVEAALLLQQGLLTGSPWSVCYDDSRAPASLTQQQQTHIRLVSRVAALVPRCERRGAWRLGFNRDLLAFGSAVRLVQKTAANCLDAACLVQAVSSATGRERMARLLALKAAAPAECVSSVGSALVVHQLLSEYARGGKGCWARVLETAGDSVVAPRQVVADAQALGQAVLAMAGELGGGGAGVKEALDWARPAFGEALG
ncbi:hypothetical protein GGI07_002630 [Coemansia sp. Benny D115]|nr:hypothetical protein GGI07_002630 [Coemansia sp. Benny D115]